MTWLTLQVDSGDRRLASSWGPPVETERKEDLSLCLNILSLPPQDLWGVFQVTMSYQVT